MIDKENLSNSKTENRINMSKFNSNKQPILNPIKNRLLMLSPTVQEGLERECNKDDFEALDDKALGKGGFGHVWKVRNKVTNKIYAIKVILKEYIKKENMVDQINREIEIMYRTDHPHIIKLYNHYEDDENFYLIMHCASKGQLYSLLKKVKRLDERTVSQYLRELISAVKYLHSMNPPIIHRDIKPENILLDSDGRSKLADFGWSNFQDENKQRETYCGTPEYLAPEMVNKSGHDESIDIWSIGVLMFELLAGRPPFVYKGDTSVLYNDIKNLKIKWTDDFPLLAKNLVSKILRLKPNERPSLDEILNHPWFKETPIIRPVLEAYKYDPAAKLQSHLVHCVPDEEMISSEIKTIVSERRISILKQGSISLSQKDVSEKELILERELKLKNEEVLMLKDDLQKKEKIMDEMKKKINNIENDETTLRIRDQERYSFISEIDTKNKKLMESQSELNLVKNECEQRDKQFRVLKESFEDLSIKSTYLEKTVNELTNNLNKLSQEKQEDIMKLEMKLRIAEFNFVSDSDSTTTDKYDPDKILRMTREYLSELVELVKYKFSKLEDKIMTQENTEWEYRNQLTAIIDKKINDLVSNFKTNNERIINEQTSYFNKQLEEAEIKNKTVSQNLEWYKQQIAELFPYKQKANKDNYLLEKLGNEVNSLKLAKEILNEKNFYLDDYVKKLSESLVVARNAKEKYKNAFLEAENLFSRYVTGKNLRVLINFKDNFPES